MIQNVTRRLKRYNLLIVALLIISMSFRQVSNIRRTLVGN